MFYQLPPAGNPVSLAIHSNDSLPAFLSSSYTQFYASGTAALAATVMAAMAYAAKQKNILADAEVILPAYGCPDLVSAVIFAGAKPVLVDTQVECPWLDLDKLAATITKNTVAIIGVNLFGIAERWAQLRVLATQANVVLIEDSAQYFPGINAPKNGEESWHGDLVVFSFGRGKPVSLLGGGAAYANNAVFYDLLPKVQEVPAGLKQTIIFTLKAKLYNAMVSPRLYWLLQLLPFLHLGETRYHALLEITGMGTERKKRLAVNILRYQNDKKPVQSSGKISQGLASLEHVIDLPVTCGKLSAASGSGLGERRLLRYPILVATHLRDEVCEKLNRAGLGASKMYPTVLPRIDGLQSVFPDQDFPQASVFASKLITLPVHAGVSSKDAEKIVRLLKNI